MWTDIFFESIFKILLNHLIIISSHSIVLQDILQKHVELVRITMKYSSASHDATTPSSRNNCVRISSEDIGLH